MVTTSTYWDNDGIYFTAQTYYGLSTDPFPTNVANGSIFIEIDTKSLYFFDAESSEWVLWFGDGREETEETEETEEVTPND